MNKVEKNRSTAQTVFWIFVSFISLTIIISLKIYECYLRNYSKRSKPQRSPEAVELKSPGRNENENFKIIQEDQISNSISINNYK